VLRLVLLAQSWPPPPPPRAPSISCLQNNLGLPAGVFLLWAAKVRENDNCLRPAFLLPGCKWIMGSASDELCFDREIDALVRICVFAAISLFMCAVTRAFACVALVAGNRIRFGFDECFAMQGSGDRRASALPEQPCPFPSPA
jgi:hypothetical protein